MFQVTEIHPESASLPALKKLWRDHADTLGFFPDGAFDDYARRRNILAATKEDGTLVGYLLYRIARGDSNCHRPPLR